MKVAERTFYFIASQTLVADPSNETPHSTSFSSLRRLSRKENRKWSFHWTVWICDKNDCYAMVPVTVWTGEKRGRESRLLTGDASLGTGVSREWSKLASPAEICILSKQLSPSDNTLSCRSSSCQCRHLPAQIIMLQETAAPTSQCQCMGSIPLRNHKLIVLETGTRLRWGTDPGFSSSSAGSSGHNRQVDYSESSTDWHV